MVVPSPEQVTAQRILDGLRSPLAALPKYGQVLHQKEGVFTRYDPRAITHRMQLAILSYFTSPPRNAEGQTLWPTILTARQMGKSLTVEYAGAVKAAFTPGFDHVCIADRKDRAEYLHNRVHQLIRAWDGPVKPEPIPGREARQLTFAPAMGGKMRTLSAESSAVGIGQSPDSFHASECPFWSDFAKTMSFIYPSILNRDEVFAVFEATPWVAGSDWHEHWREAAARRGRHLGLFFPFWDGKLNSRSWPVGQQPAVEELRALEKYGHLGLGLDNLMFRRLVMDTDVEIRRDPGLFEIYYPSSPVECWIVPSGGAIPRNVVDLLRQQKLTSWAGDGTQIYGNYDPEAHYVIGVDPAGFAARDHAAIVVLECWADRWEQVATHASHTDPPSLWREIEAIAKEFSGRDGKVPLLAPERNGVGEAIISMARMEGYSNLFHEKPGSPGIWTSETSAQEMLTALCDVTEQGILVLRDADLVDQLATYKNDKVVERTARSEILSTRSASGRRARHHWDKVSALLMAIKAARTLPNRFRRRDIRDEGKSARLFPGCTWDDVNAIRRADERRKRRDSAAWRSRHASVYVRPGTVRKH